jgi:PKD repeat protein
MRSKTDTTKKAGQYILPKMVKTALAILLFAIATNGFAQSDSCSAKARFTLATTDYKNIAITNYSSGSNLKYLWDFMDGTSSTDPNPGTHFYNNLAMHYIYLQITDTIKNCSSSFLDTVLSPCSANFSFTTYHQDVNFFNKSAGPGTTILVWDFGDGSTSTLPTPSHHYKNGGSYTACLTVTSTVDTTCSDRRCLSVVIQDSTSNYDSCSAKYVYYSPHGFTNIFYAWQKDRYYLWDFGDGTTSTLQSPKHTFPASLSYNVCLTVTSPFNINCYDKWCNNVVISDTTSNDSTLTVCSAQYTYNRQYAFTYSFHATQNDRNYLWDFGDGTTSTLQNPDHTFQHNLSYNVCLTVSSKTSAFCKDNYCNIIFVDIPKYCHSFFTIVPDSSTADPYDFLIYNQSYGNNLQYLWNFGDGSTSTLVNPTHDYAGVGPYQITLYVANDSCHDEYRDTLDLSDTVHHLLPGKFHVTVVNKTTGIKKNDLEKVTLSNYPNPFNGTTTISYGIFTSSRVELEVYNLLGVKVASIEAGSKAPGNYTLEWDAQHLQEGIYLLQLKANDQVVTKKIVINK